MQSPAWSDLLERDADLGALNTLALPARARFYARIGSLDSLRRMRDAHAAECGRSFVLGGGSNLVLTGDYEGLVLHVSIPGRELAGEDDEAWYVRAGAGENWHDFVLWTLTQGWPGLENLSLIPGSVGAAPVQNIGAYGLELAERFHSLTAFDMHTGKIHTFDRAACRFGYRDSVFRQEGWYREGRFVITDVSFRLPKMWQAVIRHGEVADELGASRVSEPSAAQIARAVIAVRQRKLPDPARIPNVGSFFHNPVVDAAMADRLRAAHPGLPSYPQVDGRVKLAAGWLIERAGWKGRDLGPVGMYEKQSLVMVNHGGATGADVTRLMQAVQNEVLERYGVTLVAEPVIL